MQSAAFNMPIRPENVGRYPPDWREISYRIRAVRANWQCECEGECGRGHIGRCPNVHGDVLQGPRANVYAIVLTVAHLDRIPEHCGDHNLRAMCQGCHLHYDRDQHAQTARQTRRSGKARGDFFE